MSDTELNNLELKYDDSFVISKSKLKEKDINIINNKYTMDISKEYHNYNKDYSYNEYNNFENIPRIKQREKSEIKMEERARDHIKTKIKTNDENMMKEQHLNSFSLKFVQRELDELKETQKKILSIRGKIYLLIYKEIEDFKKEYKIKREKELLELREQNKELNKIIENIKTEKINYQDVDVRDKNNMENINQYLNNKINMLTKYNNELLNILENNKENININLEEIKDKYKKSEVYYSLKEIKNMVREYEYNKIKRIQDEHNKHIEEIKGNYEEKIQNIENNFIMEKFKIEEKYKKEIIKIEKDYNDKIIIYKNKLEQLSAKEKVVKEYMNKIYRLKEMYKKIKLQDGAAI